MSSPSAPANNACADAFGAVGIEFNNFGRQDVTLTLQYSLVRAAPDSGIAEQDAAAAVGLEAVFMRVDDD